MRNVEICYPFKKKIDKLMQYVDNVSLLKSKILLP